MVWEKERDVALVDDTRGELSILVVEDDEGLCRLVLKRLKRAGFDAAAVNTGEAAVTWAEEMRDVLLLLDYGLSDMTGKGVLERLARKQLQPPFIMMTGQGDERTAVTMMKEGARDYLVKDARFLDRIVPVVHRVLKELEAERKLVQAEEALRLSEERLQRFIDSATDAFSLWDSQLDLVLNNRAAMEMFFPGKAEVLGRNLRELIPDIEKTGKLDRYLEVIKTGKPFQVDAVVPAAELGERHLAIRAFKACDGLGMVVSDITERKRAEKERLRLETRIQQARRFESLNVMAGSIAHNFNNLMTVVLGNLELLAGTVPPGSEQGQDIEEARQATERAAELSVLMLTYVGQGRRTSTTIDLAGLVRGLAPKLQKLQMEIERDVAVRIEPPGGPAFFRGDADWIRKLITNLATNASEALGDDGGEIVVSVGATRCAQSDFQTPFLEDDLPGGPYVYCEVSDTGCGMDRETVARIFDPFFTTKFTGRGLGMAAALGIARAHRGAISIDSEPGRGTRVQVLLPAIEDPRLRRSRSSWRPVSSQPQGGA
jgi:PAS domain S-box-containing protein